MLFSKNRKRSGKLLRCELLEDRRMLSISAADDQTLQVFHAQDALFAENAGQWDSEEVYFGYNKGGTQIYFTDDGLDFGLSRTVEETAATALEPFDAEEIESTHFSLSFDGATPTVPVGTDQAVTKFNYHLGDQENWVDGVSTYKTVLYNDLYSGIDLHTFSLHGQMKYEFHVDPGADYTQIELSYTGIEGLSISPEGGLHIATELGEIVDEDLYIYQIINGTEVEITGQFTLLDADTYTFTITGDYDPTTELIIDPNIDWGSYLGGSGVDCAESITTDPVGNVYVCGYTKSSNDWGISGGWNTSIANQQDGYVVKLNSDGAHIWSTYLGGSDIDGTHDVCTDMTGNVYVCGFTSSSDWDIAGGWDTTLGTRQDGFLVKLNSDGTHIWSTYIGGADLDVANNISIDPVGNIYICGATYSPGWVADGWDTSYCFGTDGYVVKLNPSGGHIWSTYLGGSGNEYTYGVDTDATGNVYVCGFTTSSNWGIDGGGDTSYGGDGDSYVIKFNSNGSHIWSTYLGGSDPDFAYDVSTDITGDVYVCGETLSSGWIAGGWDTSYENRMDGYVFKLNSSGDHLWSTYLGGDNSDYAAAISTDTTGNVYVCGSTCSTGWIAGGYDISLDGDQDGYVVKFNAEGKHIWSSYVGGRNIDSILGICTNVTGSIYVCGQTKSSDWDITDGWDTSYGGNSDGYIIKINDKVPGDANGDGLVDGSDVTILASNWQLGVNDNQIATWAMGDFNSDGKVDGSDVTILAGNWQAGVTSAVVAVSKTETNQRRQFAPPTTAWLGLATVPRKSSLPTRRFITPTPESTDAVFVESAWSSNELTAIAKDLTPTSVRKSNVIHDELFTLELDPYNDFE